MNCSSSELFSSSGSAFSSKMSMNCSSSEPFSSSGSARVSLVLRLFCLSRFQREEDCLGCSEFDHANVESKSDHSKNYPGSQLF